MHAHGERAHAISLHRLPKLQVLRALYVQEAGAAPDHENLPDLFFERQLAQGFLGPAVAIAGMADWDCLLAFFFGECGRSKGSGS